MRRSYRSGVATQAQDALLRKQLFVAIMFLFAIVGICCLNFKTYDPSRKLASVEENSNQVIAIENLKQENEDMQKAIKHLKRELASQKKKAAKTEVKTDEKVVDVPAKGDVSTASVEKPKDN